jgi:hypothetical protein
VELEAHITHGFNEFVSIDKRMSVLLRSIGPPILETFWTDPKIDLATIYQLFVILTPVTFVAHGFTLDVLTLNSVNPWFLTYQEIFDFTHMKSSREKPPLPHPTVTQPR